MAAPTSELLIVGTGGFARETLEAVRAINRVIPTWDVMGFVDDNPALRGTFVHGIEVLGGIGIIDSYSEPSLVVCIGNPGNYTVRRRIVGDLGLPGSRYATIVHPSAVIPPDTAIGPGSVVLAQTVATTAVTIGAHVAIMPGVILTHDDLLQNFCTLGSGVRLAGGVTIGEGAYVGAGALVREYVHIGEWALVGMGAGVTTDVPDAQVWAGLPARYLRQVEKLPKGYSSKGISIS